MALNPRVVKASGDVTWDGGTTTTHVSAGTLADIAPGSALETAYGGASNLRDYVPGGDNESRFGVGNAGS
jgi:hypothetical protein